MRAGLLRNIVCSTLGIVFAFPTGLFAQVAEENAVKAAFVYNFILFTEWPASALKAGETINLCVNAYSPVAPALAGYEGRTIRKSRLKVRQLNSLNDLPASCHVVYLDQLDRQAWPQIRKRIDNSSILTISDSSEVGAEAAMIVLGTNNDRIVFDISARTAGRAGLTMSSKLLRLARELR